MIVVATTPDDVGATLEMLGRLGIGDVQVIVPSDVRTLVLAALHDEWEEQRIIASLCQRGEVAVARPDGGPQLDEWIRFTKPITFGSRVSVCFAWSEHDRDGLAGLVELGLGGFGSGHHPATRLLLEQLSERLTGGEQVLDVGCGSGVLGLCALRLGATGVVAVDVKQATLDATRRNAVLNGVAHRVETSIAPLTELQKSFGVVLANVGRAAIVDLAGELAGRVATGGWLGVSGFSPSQCSLVAGFLEPLVEIDCRTSGEWAALVLTRE